MSSRSVLVTGSTSGIGLGIAKAFAKVNYNVILAGFGTKEDIAAAVADVDAIGSGSCRHVPDVDLASEEGCTKLMNEAGPVDVLVNNAGMQHVEKLETLSTDNWDRVIAVNLTAPFITTRLALPHMRKNGYGRIINIASAHGIVASANKSAYVASKHGVIGLTKVTALETCDEADVTANAILPGWVLTPLVKKQIETRARDNGTTFEHESELLLKEKHPRLDFTMPEQLGELAVFLCSDAGRAVRGASLSMDNGWTIH